jgi:hypothetical protein
MKKKTITMIIIAVVIILLGVLVWGLVGSSESAKIGTTCDFGIGKEIGGEPGSALCWTWHRNTIGQISDNIENQFS